MAAHRTRKTAGISEDTWPRRGQIYLAALDPTVGHEIRKTRPALVLQNNVSNGFGLTTMVAPIHPSRFSPKFTQIRTVDRRRFVRLLGTVDNEAMSRADQAIKKAFGLNI